MGIYHKKIDLKLNRNVKIGMFYFSFLLFSSCGRLVKTSPINVSETSNVEIRVNSNFGNQGLLDYSGDVFVHLGLITSKSEHTIDWRYVKFAWGSREKEALATPNGKNKWKYKIENIRAFFKVPPDEEIHYLAILFRSGACIDVYCKVLRNEDESDILIPIEKTSKND